MCGKSTANGRGFARVVVGGRAVELCCPMCLKVHQEREVKRAEDEVERARKAARMAAID